MKGQSGAPEIINEPIGTDRQGEYSGYTNEVMDALLMFQKLALTFRPENPSEGAPPCFERI